MFLYNIVSPYLSVYTMGLGASATQLGIVNSVGMMTAGLLAPFIGRVIDRRGIRQVYLVGVAFLAISFLTYAVAGNWTIAILAMVAYWVGKGMSGQACSTICGNSIRSEDRATAMSLCETFAVGVLGMLAPLLGAVLVFRFGGVSVSGIRPLFYIALFGTIGTFACLHPSAQLPMDGIRHPIPQPDQGLLDRIAGRRQTGPMACDRCNRLLTNGNGCPFRSAVRA